MYIFIGLQPLRSCNQTHMGDPWLNSSFNFSVILMNQVIQQWAHLDYSWIDKGMIPDRTNITCKNSKNKNWRRNMLCFVTLDSVLDLSITLLSDLLDLFSSMEAEISELCSFFFFFNLMDWYKYSFLTGECLLIPFLYESKLFLNIFIQLSVH